MVDQSWGSVGYCSRRCQARTNRRRRYRAADPAGRRRIAGQQLAPVVQVPCGRCGTPVLKRGAENKGHCQDCRPPKGHLARAGFYQVQLERFEHLEIFQRDGWQCRICHIAVDPAAPWPDLGSASLDHIVAISKGGGHTRANVQLAHLGCNIAKGAR